MVQRATQQRSISLGQVCLDSVPFCSVPVQDRIRYGCGRAWAWARGKGSGAGVQDSNTIQDKTGDGGVQRVSL